MSDLDRRVGRLEENGDKARDRIARLEMEQRDLRRDMSRHFGVTFALGVVFFVVSFVMIVVMKS